MFSPQQPQASLAGGIFYFITNMSNFCEICEFIQHEKQQKLYKHFCLGNLICLQSSNVAKHFKTHKQLIKFIFKLLLAQLFSISNTTVRDVLHAFSLGVTKPHRNKTM
jgi:hypothetical protein